MPYQPPYSSSGYDNKDTAYNPPSRNPYRPQQPPSNGGYQVASVASYLPSNMRPPSPPSPLVQDTTASQYPPPLPTLNSFHQFPANRQQDLNTVEASRQGVTRRAASPASMQRAEQGHQNMSAYRQQRQVAAAAPSTATNQNSQHQLPGQGPNVLKKSSPPGLQPRAQPMEQSIALGTLPPLPPNTRLDYGKGGQPYGEDVDTKTPVDDSFGGHPQGMTGLASAATAALAAGNILQNSAPLPKPRPLPAQPLKWPSVANHSQESFDSTASPYLHDNSSKTGLLQAAASATLVPPPAYERRGSGISGISRCRSPLRSEYAHSESGISAYAPSLETPNRTIGLGVIDPMDIADDDDDPFTVLRPGEKQGKHSPRTGYPLAVVGAGGAAGGFLKGFGSRDTSGSYGQVPGGVPFKAGSAESKSAWLSQQKGRNNRLRGIVGTSAVILIVLGIAAIVLAPILTHVLAHPISSLSSSSTSSTGTTTTTDLLTASSSEIKALLNSTSLHKVFPGMDYTPNNSQYPDCLTNPPSQNNITKDIAVLSQLTPLIRLYGTDCNVTSMVLESLSLLNLDSTSMKLMPGVWLDANTTTNTRQLSQLYSTLSSLSTSQKAQIAGVMVGNEVLFAEYLTLTELTNILTTVRQNLTSIGYSSLPIGTAELGSQWSTELISSVDVIGSNVHPFFAGVNSTAAATWTYDYWQTNDVSLSTSNTSKINVIAETGWPTSGGYYEGSTAGVKELNLFMEDWVCDMLEEEVKYWWFEAFDEDWKGVLDSNSTTDGMVETHWGLFEAGTWGLKSGVVVPSCNGSVASGW